MVHFVTGLMVGDRRFSGATILGGDFVNLFRQPSLVGPADRSSTSCFLVERTVYEMAASCLFLSFLLQVCTYLLRSWRNANVALAPHLLLLFVSCLTSTRTLCDLAHDSWVLPPQKKQPRRRPKKRAQIRVPCVESFRLPAGTGFLSFRSLEFSVLFGRVVHSRRCFTWSPKGNQLKTLPSLAVRCLSRLSLSCFSYNDCCIRSITDPATHTGY